MNVCIRIVTPQQDGYDESVPNKTIYVSDGDLALYQRAQDLAGGNLSAAIANALRRYVDIHQARDEGFEEIVVRVGLGNGRKVRFVGVLVGELLDSNSGRPIRYRVWRGRTGKYVLHIERQENFTVVDSEGKPVSGWRSWVGVGDVKYGSAPRESTIEVLSSLEQVREKVPAELFDILSRSAQQPVVEELDI
jgi:EXLDI family protein